MTDEINPCPFCGHQTIGHTANKYSLQISCGKCGATGPEAAGRATEIETWDKAIAAWNRRTATAAQEDRT